jgi:dihydroneopterin aldolase
MDYIHIENLIVRGKHGVTSLERRREQEFDISLRLGIEETTAAAKSGKLKYALDYQPIRDMIVRTIEQRSFYLIETLAQTLARDILRDQRVLTLELTVKKPEVWKSGIPGLTIVRTRS